MRLGEDAPVKAIVRLGAVEPSEVSVQLYAGSVTSLGELVDVSPIELTHASSLGDGRHEFTGRVVANRSGRFGFSVRVLPKNDLLDQPLVPGLITWFGGQAPKQAKKQKKLAGAAG